MTAPLDVVLFKRTPPRIRPLLIIITALSLGFICLGVVLTVIGNWPGYSPYGGNPLRIVGPILLAVGVIAFIGVTVDCCVRASKNKPIYEKEKSPPSVIVASQQPGVHSYAAKYNEPKPFLNQSAPSSTNPPSSTSYNFTKTGEKTGSSQPVKNAGGPPPAPPIPAGGIPIRNSLLKEGYKPLDMQRHWGEVPVEMRQLPEDRMPKKAHNDLQEASLAALMGQGNNKGWGQQKKSPIHTTKFDKPGLSGQAATGQAPTLLSNADGVQIRKGGVKRPENLEFKPAPVQPVPQAVATGQNPQGLQAKWGQTSKGGTAASDGAATGAGDAGAPGELNKEKSDSKKSLPVLQIPLSYKSDIEKEKLIKEADNKQKVKDKNAKEKSKLAAQNKGYVTDEDLWPTESTPKEDDYQYKVSNSKEQTPKSRRDTSSKRRDSSRGREKERDRRDQDRSRDRSRHHDRDDYRHRSRSQEPKGSRSRDSSRGRSRRSSLEDYNSMNYLSGKPRTGRENDSHKRDHRHGNRTFDPDTSTDSSEKRRRERERQREREKERLRRARDFDNYSEAASSAMIPAGRYHVPRRHNTSMSEVGTVIDEPLSKGINPKYTININAQPGSAVQIGFPKGGMPAFRLTRGDGLADLDSVSVMSSSHA